jgi:membrane protease YdiL (CAAX protease family)
VEFFSDSSVWTRVQIFVLVSLLAPLVEETMFRGVLYRHLREASIWLRPLLSALLSATVVSFVFAVIHPQGLLGVPALMGLAYAFALAREWRDTLIPSMVAHGINNGVAFTLSILLAGS